MSGLVDAGGNLIRVGAFPSEEEAKTEAAPQASTVLSIERLLASALYDTERSGVEVSTLLVDAPRKNDKRPALMTWAVPDRWSLSARGEPEQRDVFVALRVSRSFVEAVVGKPAQE